MGMTLDWIQSTIEEVYGPGSCVVEPLSDEAGLRVALCSSGVWFAFKVSYHEVCCVEAGGPAERAELLRLAAEAEPVGGLYGPERLSSVQRNAVFDVLSQLQGDVRMYANEELRSLLLKHGFPVDVGAFRVTPAEGLVLTRLGAEAIMRATQRVEQEALERVQALTDRVLELERGRLQESRPRGLEHGGIFDSQRRHFPQPLPQGAGLRWGVSKGPTPAQDTPPSQSPPISDARALPEREKCPWIFPWPEPADWNEGAT